MKVYVVTARRRHDGRKPRAVFSTKAQAAAFCRQLADKAQGDWSEAEPFPVISEHIVRGS